MIYGLCLGAGSVWGVECAALGRALSFGRRGGGTRHGACFPERAMGMGDNYLLTNHSKYNHHNVGCCENRGNACRSCVLCFGAHAQSLLLPVLCLHAVGCACYQPQKYHVTTPNASDLPGRGYRHIVCYPRFGACFPVRYFWSPWFVRVRSPCSAASNSGVSAAGCTRFLNLLLKSCFCYNASC